MSNTSIMEMVSQVLASSKSMLKTAEAETGGEAEEKVAAQENPQEADLDEIMKIAEGCDYLADHLHEVIDDRSAEEKLAEYATVHEELLKAAQDEIPQNPPLDSGAPLPGGPGTAMKAEQADAPGTSLDAGESGEATPGHQSPKAVAPSEKPNPADAPNALETNKEMMMAEQPEDVLKQAQAKVREVLEKEGKQITPAMAQKAMQVSAVQDPKKPGAETAGGGTLKKASEFTEKMAEEGHVPKNVAEALLGKLAEDAINPAKIGQQGHAIEGGTTPDLQSPAGVPPAQSQGSEAGELTPREAAPTEGAGGGRELVGSNDAAIDATKGQAKQQNKGQLAEVLTEPAMSKTHDKTLHESLDNTQEAGVKISAARELLKKLAASDPDIKKKIGVLVKMAEGADLTPEEASMAGEASPEEMVAAQAIADAAAEGESQQMSEAEKESMIAGAPPATGQAAPPPMAPPAMPPAGAAPAAAPAGAPAAAPPMPPTGQM